MKGLTHFSCFTGIAGIDLSAATAGFDCVGQVEIGDYPNRILEARFPDVPRWRDIRNVTRESLEERRIEGVTVMSGGFPCFPAGTLIETPGGYKEIETIVIGDFVRTHIGRFKRVTNVMKREAPVMVIRIRGTVPIESTHEHPFYVRKIVRSEFEDPQWVHAKDLNPLCHFAALALPVQRPKKTGNMPAITFDNSVSTWHFVGHYIGNGWIVEYKRTGRKNSYARRVVVCDGHKDAQELEYVIQKAGFSATKDIGKSVVKYHITSSKLVDFLLPFGRGAIRKMLPSFVFSLPKECQRALFRGWIDSDGYENDKVICGTTVSKKLALGMARLARSVLKMSVTVRKVEVPSQKIIEGRTVNQNPFYQVRCWKNSRSIWKRDGTICWSKVSKVEETGNTKIVYNLSVEEDESYVADECIVHNCQPFSIAGKRQGKNDDRYLWPETLRVLGLIKPRWFVGENVAGITSMESPEPVFNLEGKTGFQPVHERILGEITKDLKKEGFLLPQCTDGMPIIFLIPACGVGAPHRRYRVFIVAYNNNLRWEYGSTGGQGVLEGKQACDETGAGDQPTSNPAGILIRQEPPTRENETGLCGAECSYSLPDSSLELQSCRCVGTQRERACHCCQDDPDTNVTRLEGGVATGPGCSEGRLAEYLISHKRDYEEGSVWSRHWLEVATRVCRIHNEFSTWLDEFGGILEYAPYPESMSRQDLSILRKNIQSGEIWEEIGRCYKIPSKEILLSFMCALEKESNRQNNVSCTGKEIQEIYLRTLRKRDKDRYSSSERGHHGQQAGKYSDDLPSMSHDVALACESVFQIYKAETDYSNRLQRLKALGNAVVPAQIYPIFKYIAEIETKT